MKFSLKACRINKGYTLEIASDLIGVTPATLHNWESGKTEPKLEYIDNIIKVYEVPYDLIAFK